jgi:predicted HAD superfamily phosphohydrolase YqeG
MPPDRRGIVFDLDDTLFPMRRYRLSGFAAVAAHL